MFRVAGLALRLASGCKSQIHRWLSVHVQSRFIEILPDNNGSQSETSRPALQIPTVWLRDHCYCSQCYNATTWQRNLDVCKLTVDIRPKIVDLHDESLYVTWPDGHVSQYSLTWLQSCLTDKRRPVAGVKTLWCGARMTVNRLPIVTYADYQTERGLVAHLSNIIQYGLSCVTNVPVSKEETETVATRTAMIEETIYGRMWVFDNQMMQHADTAYTNAALGAHTDLTYYTFTPGLQVFHQLEHVGGGGGENVFVDGFHCAQLLQQTNREAFRFLSSVPIPHHFFDKGTHLCSREPVLKLDHGTGELVQFRFNPYDRAPLTGLAPADIPAFYASYQALARIVRDPANEFWMKLRPGMVLFIDNYRLMHGRNEITGGKRVLAGCYISREDFLSKARVAHVI